MLIKNIFKGSLLSSIRNLMDPKTRNAFKRIDKMIAELEPRIKAYKKITNYSKLILTVRSTQIDSKVCEFVFQNTGPEKLHGVHVILPQLDSMGFGFDDTYMLGGSIPNIHIEVGEIEPGGEILVMRETPLPLSCYRGELSMKTLANVAVSASLKYRPYFIILEIIK
jgi:hypothetical protein